MPESEIYAQMFVIIVVIFLPILAGATWLGFALFRSKRTISRKGVFFGFVLGAIVPAVALLRNWDDIGLGLARLLAFGCIGAVVGGIIAALRERVEGALRE
ncbi:MAG: hypothetical protein JNK90_22875 [Planctomycetaceae bacterium]|nr:hypothetical protein [Planctomycetaceae bacterium]